MTTPKVCVDANMSVTSGVLGIAKWSAPRMVAQTTVTSTGDGTIASTGLTTQPGRLMLDAAVSWVSDSPLTAWMRLQVIRGYRTIISSNPNIVEIWDSWEYGIDQAARVPSNYSAANGFSTLGFDVGTDTNAQPVAGVIGEDYPATCTEDWIELPAGSTLNVRYQAYCWTPPPWSNNANANIPVHEADSRSVKLRLWAYPSADRNVR